MRIARGGVSSIFALTLASAGACLVSKALAAVLALPLALALWFYRDPERTAPDGPGLWVSPADGRVVEIEYDAFDHYAGRTVKIGIFMNGFDVHVNRFPSDGVVEGISHVPGRKWFAIAPKASELNERLRVCAMTPQGRVTVVQIAGILARRISCYVKDGEELARGERYGMIKLGSKVDVYMPVSVVPKVRLGDRVKAGVSIIGVVDK
ncbi:MAG: phosphatidylserine decarboxylase [Synergistaceae bacterium]|jgi:phosphatidylserine decarboxylase|nr:phosphatidylserine decarboxylase [Synergistaceae bacterium]